MCKIIWMIGTFLILCIIMSIVTIYDVRHFCIPNYCSVALACTGIIYSIIDHQKWIDCMLGFVSISMPLICLYFLTHKMAIGGGDIKLLAASGILLGWKKNLLAFMISGICLLIHTAYRPPLLYEVKKIALGPYLSIGILISFAAGDFFIECYSNWSGISIILM